AVDEGKRRPQGGSMYLRQAVANKDAAAWWFAGRDESRPYNFANGRRALHDLYASTYSGRRERVESRGAVVRKTRTCSAPRERVLSRRTPSSGVHLGERPVHLDDARWIAPHLLAHVRDRPVHQIGQTDFRLVSHRVRDLRQVRHTALHVFETVREHVVVWNEANRGLAARATTNRL